jgi:hypothetical protein
MASGGSRYWKLGKSLLRKPEVSMTSDPARARRQELWRVLRYGPYNKLLRGGWAQIKPEYFRHFYMISAGKGRIGPETEPTGVIFSDGSFLRLFEKWRTRDNALLEYSYHYQVPNGVSVRYEMDSAAATPDHPEYHLHISELGDECRLPTGRVSGEEILQMIFEQFVGPTT